MHLEILVEDMSGKKLLEAVLPNVFADETRAPTWRIICYRGLGRIPPDLKKLPSPANRFLLDQLPRLLRGYGRTFPEGKLDTSVVVVLDCDRAVCKNLLSDMTRLLSSCNPKPRAMFRIAIEECEAWILGDRKAIRSAYPRARPDALDSYEQDSICGTWEVLAEALHPGGSAALAKMPYSVTGRAKCEWAERIGPKIDVEANRSYSFGKFRDGLRSLVAVR